MKASIQPKLQLYQQNTPASNYVESFGPQTLQNRKLNRSLLEKYSFQDHDLSRTSQLISQQDHPSDDQDWLRLEIKEITTIGRELITFYLSVKYIVEYQTENSPNFDKKKTESKVKQNLKEVKEVKSKLVHGSILQSEHKNLVLNLKCKKQQDTNQNGVKPILTLIEFSIMRIFEAKNQPVLISKQIIEVPQVGDQYEIGFIQENPPKGVKAKPIATMIFQINSAIQQELDGSQNGGTERESGDEEVSEHLENQDDRERIENYTLGKSQNLKKPNTQQPANKASAQVNIFDDSNNSAEDDEDSDEDEQKFQDNITSSQNNSYISQQKSSNVEIIQKLNELSSMMDKSLEKSKNQDQAYKSYLQETSNMIVQFQSNDKGQNKKVDTVNQKAQNKEKKIINQQANFSSKNQGNANSKRSPQQNLKKVNITNPSDSNTLNDRYNYVSRVQNTYIAGQKFNYQSRLENSNSANTDNEKFNYQSRAQMTTNKNLTIEEKFTSGSKADDSNIVGERFNYESSRVDDTKIVGERYDYQSRIQNSNFLDESNLNDLSLISPIQPNSPLNQKKSNFFKKQPFFQFNANAKKQINQISNNPNKSPRNAQQTGENQGNQASSRFVPFSLSELDSSNIRYQYNDNEVSNIQETKNMQELINQIEKIQKEWYEKRVLNRKNREDKEKKENGNQEDQKIKPFDLVQNPDDLLDLQLKNFKIKFSEETFYRKLIDGLKNKHLTYLKRNQANQNAETQIPQNYLVFLVANEVDEENMDFESESNSKIQIKIPSQQIHKLLELQNAQKQKSFLNSGENDTSPTMSRVQQKQIIKAFEKQLYSKVMKIKINKSSKTDKNGTGEKKKVRIIQIALEEQSLTLSQLDVQGTIRDPQENRISLIGMYPLPIFGDEQKDGETSFYQNVSIEPLAIELYDTKTGAQEGQLKFELAKGKVDREIQTLQPLEDIEEYIEGEFDHKNSLVLESKFSLPVGYEVHQQKQLIEVSSPKNNDPKKSFYDEQVKQKTLEVQISQPLTKEKFLNPNAQQKQLNRQIQSQYSRPYSFQSQQLPLNISLNFDQAPKKINSNRYIQPDSRQSLQNSTPLQNGSLKKIKNSIKLNQDHQNHELLSSISKVRPKSNNDTKKGQILGEQRPSKESPNKNKDVDMIGKIMKNHSSSLMEPQPFESNTQKIQLGSRQNNLSEQKLKPVPSLEIKDIKTKTPQKITKIQKNPSIKLYNVSNIAHQTAPAILNSPSSIYDNPDNQSENSYVLMKQEFLATANLLESIKLKAQEFIDKVQSERKIHTSDDPQSDKEIWKGYQSRGESNFAYTLPVEKRAINLEVNSFVVNETILSKKQKSRNQLYTDQFTVNPITVPINPQAGNNLPSKRTSTNKSRNSRHDNSPKQARRSKFTLPVQRESESIKSRNKNYEKDKQSEGSVASVNEKKSKKKDKFKKPLTYKEESDYQFTEEEGRNQDDRRKNRDHRSFKSSKKLLNAQQYSEEELEQSGMNYSRVPQNQYPQAISPIKSGKRNIKESAISSFSSQQLIEIKIFSLKIKLLSLPLVAKHLRNLSDQSYRGKEYFVLVYTDFSVENKGVDDDVSFMSPVAQKCIRKNEAKEDEFVVLFNEKTQNAGFLLLKGVQKTKLVIELYQSSQLPKQLQTSSKEKDLTSLEHISLITLSPQHKKSQNKPFASLSVTFIQLLAQQQSSNGFDSRLESSSDLITYTNFLYDKEKILGKININYITELQGNKADESNSNYYQGSRSKPKLYGSRKQVIEEYKPIKNSFLKEYSNTRKNNHSQKDELKRLRSESGMTKKLSPRRKKQAEKTEQHSQNQRSNFMGHTTENQADPLEILKRRVPKPIRSEEKRNSHSQSYAIRLNRPYHTPMNKGNSKQLFDSLNSSSSVKFKGERLRQRRHKDSGFSSSHFEGEPAILESPKKGSTNAQLMQLRQKKQQKKLRQLKAYQAVSRVPGPFQQTQDTRISQNRKYEGGNIKFGKSSRFNSGDSQQMISRKGSKQQIPGPGHYEVKSLFDRHIIKEP